MDDIEEKELLAKHLKSFFINKFIDKKLLCRNIEEICKHNVHYNKLDNVLRYCKCWSYNKLDYKTYDIKSIKKILESHGENEQREILSLSVYLSNYLFNENERLGQSKLKNIQEFCTENVYNLPSLCDSIMIITNLLLLDKNFGEKYAKWFLYRSKNTFTFYQRDPRKIYANSVDVGDAIPNSVIDIFEKYDELIKSITPEKIYKRFELNALNNKLISFNLEREEKLKKIELNNKKFKKKYLWQEKRRAIKSKFSDMARYLPAIAGISLGIGAVGGAIGTPIGISIDDRIIESDIVNHQFNLEEQIIDKCDFLSFNITAAAAAKDKNNNTYVAIFGKGIQDLSNDVTSGQQIIEANIKIDEKNYEKLRKYYLLDLQYSNDNKRLYISDVNMKIREKADPYFNYRHARKALRSVLENAESYVISDEPIYFKTIYDPNDIKLDDINYNVTISNKSNEEAESEMLP